MAEREELEFVLFIGTATMVAVALGLIAFIVFYQRKIIAKQRRINEIELKNQKRLVAAEINTKEREQKRIAQELHDDIGSSLTAIRFMTQKIDDSQEVKKELMEALGVAAGKVRRISNDLLPHVLEELGLIDALIFLTSELNKSGGTSFVFTFKKKDFIILEKGEQLSLYRIVQELCNNILKYAEAKNVQIELKGSATGLVLIISDDGNGIIPVKNERSESLGLKNIESRIQYIGGEIDRSLGKDKGTVVTITKVY